MCVKFIRVGLVIAVLGYQLEYIWNELHSKIKGHTYMTFAWFEVDEYTSHLDLRDRKTHAFDLNFEEGKSTFSRGHTFCWKSI